MRYTTPSFYIPMERKIQRNGNVEYVVQPDEVNRMEAAKKAGLWFVFAGGKKGGVRRVCFNKRNPIDVAAESLFCSNAADANVFPE